jgi:hypothetical protein
MSEAFGHLPEEVQRLAAEIEAVTGPIHLVQSVSLPYALGALSLKWIDGRPHPVITYAGQLTPETAIHELLHARRALLELVPWCKLTGLRLFGEDGKEISDMSAMPGGEIDNHIEHLFVYPEQARLGFPKTNLSGLLTNIIEHLHLNTPDFMRRLLAFGAWAAVQSCTPELIPVAMSALRKEGLWYDARRYWDAVQNCRDNKRALVKITANAINLPLKNLEMTYLRRRDGIWEFATAPVKTRPSTWKRILDSPAT